MTLKEHQPALDIKQQIDNLKGKQLIIEDEKAASDFLNDVSYFRLIKAYSLGFQDFCQIFHAMIETAFTNRSVPLPYLLDL